jgi:hypothetical protein
MPEASRLPVIAIDGDELLATFAEVMIEWGHHRTAHDLRYPTLAEARQAAARRRDDRGWNTSPFPGKGPAGVSGA